MEKQRAITARFPTTCSICNTKHITPGVSIVPYNNGWAHIDCYNSLEQEESEPNITSDIPPPPEYTDDPEVVTLDVTVPDITPESEEEALQDNKSTELSDEEKERIISDAQIRCITYSYRLSPHYNAIPGTFNPNSSLQDARHKAKRDLQATLDRLKLLPDQPNNFDALIIQGFRTGILNLESASKLAGSHFIKLSEDGKEIEDLRGSQPPEEDQE